ncbi:hypothetical protein [Nocardia tengchongensis]
MTHPYDYYYRPGMPLRPPPPRAIASDLWFEPRKAVLRAWIDVRREPFGHHDSTADTPCCPV